MSILTSRSFFKLVRWRSERKCNSKGKGKIEGKGKGKSMFLRRLMYRFRKPPSSSIITSFELRSTLTASDSSHGPRFKRHLMQAQGVKD